MSWNCNWGGRKALLWVTLIQSIGCLVSVWNHISIDTDNRHQQFTILVKYRLLCKSVLKRRRHEGRRRNEWERVSGIVVESFCSEYFWHHIKNTTFTLWSNIGFTLKGSFTIFLFLVISHILNSNGVWYWWFCPEGPKNAPNSRFLGFYFVPRDLDSQRHMGPWLAAQGTSTRGAMGPWLKSMAPRVEVPCAASRGPMLSFGRL